MRLHRLKLRGFIGIHHGMGLDEIKINFDEVGGLIAFSGANGKGKTTVLENMHPYRQMVSRDGALKNQVRLKDSCKELVFTMGGHEYSTVVNINAKTGKQEAFIYKDGDEASLTTGKVREYDEIIEGLFGSPALFFSSVFCAQNSRKLSDLKPAELKALFTEFLGLERIAEYEETAKLAIGILSGRIDGMIEDERMLLDKLDAMPYVNLAQRVDKQRAIVSELEGQEPAFQKVHDDAEAGYRRIMAQATTQESEKKLAQQLQDDWDELNRERSRLARRYIKRREDLEKRKQSIEAELDEWREKEKGLTTTSALQRQLDANDTKAKGLNTQINVLQREADHIRDIVAQIGAVGDSEFKKYQLQEAAIKDDQAAEATHQSKLQGMKHDFQRNLDRYQNDPKLIKLEADYQNLCQQTNTLDLKDPECASSKCGFIVETIEVQKMLPTMQKQLEAAQEMAATMVEQAQADIATVDDELAKSAERDRQIEEDLHKLRVVYGQEAKARTDAMAEHNKKIDAIRKQWEAISQETDDLALAIKSIRGMMLEAPNPDTVQAQLKNLGANHKQVIDDMASETQERDRLLAINQERQDSIREQLAEINIDEEIDKKLEKANQLYQNARKGLEEIKADLVQTRWELDEMEKNHVPAAMEMIDEQKRLEEHRRQLTTHLDDWDYIRKVCGKDGLRALEVDSVAPTIAGHANELLQATYGAGMSIRFLTKDPETHKEVLKILAIRDGGVEDPIELLSGGERVWTLKALLLALTITAKEQSGRAFSTAFADEEDGALDKDNAINFVRMHQRFMSLGGFTDCFFISHKPSCVDMADSSLVFNGAGVEVA